MDTNLHPVFQEIFAAHLIAAPAIASANELRVAAYISALERFDWFFEDSDDHRVWSNGRVKLCELREEQRRIDADGAVWNQHCKVREYRVPERDVQRALPTEQCDAMDETIDGVHA